jgi:hypothetical protein
MNAKQANKAAATLSKTESVAHVVYVPDEGYAVWNAAQLAKWGALVFVETTYTNGANHD